MMAVNKALWPVCVEDGKIWKLIQLTYGDAFPEEVGIEVEKTLNTTQNTETLIVVLRTNVAWERAMDKIKGNLRTVVGVFQADKKRHGRAPASKVGASNVPADDMEIVTDQ